MENFLEAAYHVAEGLAVNLALPQVELLGPVPAPMERRAGRHRAQLLLQSSIARPCTGCWASGRQLESLPEARQVRWSLDVDPIDLF